MLKVFVPFVRRPTEKGFDSSVLAAPVLSALDWNQGYISWKRTIPAMCQSWVVLLTHPAAPYAAPKVVRTKSASRISFSWRWVELVDV